jgi:hypothetical protein
MDGDISVPPKGVFDSLAAFRAVRNFAACHQNTAALRAISGACSAEQKPAEEAVAVAKTSLQASIPTLGR